MYPMKHKYLCDYYPICIMSRGFIFDDITMGIIRKNEFPHPTEENDFLFTHIDNNIIYMYRGNFNILMEKRNLRVSRNATCTFTFKKE